MKLPNAKTRPPRVEMLPLIDIVFLLLVVFIYTMLSMAVHKGLPVALPTSSEAKMHKDPAPVLSITVKADSTVFVDKTATDLEGLGALLARRVQADQRTGVLLFADRNLPYQSLFKVLDRIRQAGVTRINLQAQGQDGS